MKMIHQAFVCFICILCSGIAAERIPRMSDIGNQTALVGENVTFLCEIFTDKEMDNKEQFEIQWVRHFRINGSYVNEYGEPYLEVKKEMCINKNRCVLNLLNVTQTDQEWYTCIVATTEALNYRSAWLSVFSEIDIPPPNNVSALQTPNGISVTWDQPKTAIEVTSYRVYYKSNFEDDFNIWKYPDTGGTSTHILLPEFRKCEQYTLKFQAIYNIYHSKNVTLGAVCSAATEYCSNNRNIWRSVYNLYEVSPMDQEEGQCVTKVIIEIDIPPPNNVLASQTPNGISVTWDQPKTALEVTSYRVYYKSNFEDDFNIWKYPDTCGTSTHILLPEFRKCEQYTLKVQAIYNIYHSKNVTLWAVCSAENLQDGQSNTEESEYMVYVLIGIYAIIILLLSYLGFTIRRRYKNVHSKTGKSKVIQRNRRRSSAADVSLERGNALYEEIDDYNHSYESIASDNLEGQLSLMSNRAVNEPVQDESYSREELGNLTATKVLYTGNNESTNYIHPVYSHGNSNTRLSQYVHGRIPDYSEYVYGRIPDNFCIADNINQNTRAIDSEYVYGRIPDDFAEEDIFTAKLRLDGRDFHSV